MRASERVRLIEGDCLEVMLVQDMAADSRFVELTRQGQLDLDEGRVSGLAEVKRRLDDGETG